MAVLLASDWVPGSPARCCRSTAARPRTEEARMSTEAVAAVKAGIADAMSVFEDLSPEEWAAPSGCEGWRVQDVAAHMSSNFKATADPPPRRTSRRRPSPQSASWTCWWSRAIRGLRAGPRRAPDLRPAPRRGAGAASGAAGRLGSADRRRPRHLRDARAGRRLRLRRLLPSPRRRAGAPGAHRPPGTATRRPPGASGRRLDARGPAADAGRGVRLRRPRHRPGSSQVWAAVAGRSRRARPVAS